MGRHGSPRACSSFGRARSRRRRGSSGLLSRHRRGGLVASSDSPPRSDQTGTDDRPKPSVGARPRGSVEYKGAPLDAEKGPGLGCFWVQIVVLAIVVVLTPLSAA